MSYPGRKARDVKLPSKDIGPWASEIVSQCTASRETRRTQYRQLKSYFYTGASNGQSTMHNKCYNQVDKLSSYLFSPSEVRFTLKSDESEGSDWSGPLGVSARHINDEFERAGCGLSFGSAVDVALTYGCGFVKTTWSRDGYEPHVILPQFMGVLREDVMDLDRQEAFVHSYYMTPDAFARLVANHPDKDELISRAATAADVKAEAEVGDDYFHEIIVGGIAPLAYAPNTSTGQGNVVITGVPMPQLSPNVASKLIKIDELWVWDDKRSDWTTIRLGASDLVIEGQYQHRNLSDAPGEHPFVKVCADEVPGYFWGRSELANIVPVQDTITSWLGSMGAILKKQANPPRMFSGTSAITPEKARALLMPGGTLMDDSPTAKVETMAPTMPAMAMEYLSLLDQYADEAGGFTNILSGQSDAGVRAGTHANTLLRTSSPRLRDKALRVEKQVATFGNLCLQMSQAKNARVFKVRKASPSMMDKITGKGDQEFMLSQLPDDVRVAVDSHTSSPAFSGDAEQKAFMLAKAGAIDGKSLIELVHPPREDELIQRWETKQEQQAELIKQHPELLQQGAKKKR